MALRLLVLLSAFFLFSTSREPPWGDAHVTYETTQQLVDHGQLDIHLRGGPPWFYAHRNGHQYGVFPVGNVVAMVPSYLAFKLLRLLPGLPEPPLFALASHLSPALLMAFACVLFFRLCRRRGADPGWSVFLTLTLGLATQCFIYARSPYAEALQTVALLWLVERTLEQGARPTPVGLGWWAVAAGLLVNSKLVYALLLPPIGAYLIWMCWRAGALRRLLGGLPVAAVVFAEFAALALVHNHIKTGSLWDSGYKIPQGVFSGELEAALYGFTLSPGKSLFVYSPPVLLGVLGLLTAIRRQGLESGLLLVVTAATLLFNAKFRFWAGDYCWGPRLLTPVVPLLLLLAVPWLPEAVARGRRRLRRAALGGVVAAGLVVQLLGASFYWDHYIRALIIVKDETGASGWFQEALSHGHFIPVFSPILGHHWMLKHLLHDDPDLDRDAPWKQVVPQPARLDEIWTRMRLDWWVLDWFSNRRPARVAGVVVIALLFGAATWSGAGIRRRLERPD